MAKGQAPPKSRPRTPAEIAGSKSGPAATAAAGSTSNKHIPRARGFTVQGGLQDQAHRIALYGPGGVGKSTLASMVNLLGLKPKFIDVEGGSKFLDVDRIQGTNTFEDVRDALNSDDLWTPNDVVVIDTATKLEEMCLTYTLKTVPHEKGHKVDSIEGYGWGKGPTFVYESFLLILADLDRLFERGISSILICHDCTANVPNPAGEDFIRYEPRLMAPNSGKASIRHRVREWVDHLFFIGYDVFAKDGKATGAGTRTIYPTEMPTHWAKSRLLAEPYPFNFGDATIWSHIFNREIASNELPK